MDQDLIERAVAFRRDLHQHPELAYDEERTAARIRSELDRLGIPWRACAGTGTVGSLAAGAPGKTIALRADIDALPITECTGLPYASTHDGRMHACGHDGHAASLIAAAEVLKRREADLPGPVVLLFQPAEEGGHGARSMVADGCLEGVDEVYGYHNWPPIPFGRAAVPPGPVMAANAEFRYSFVGAGGHASQPEVCVDPLPAAAAFVSQVQAVVSRFTAPQQAAVVTVATIHGGEMVNAIADGCAVGGTVRAGTSALRQQLLDAVLRVAEGCAQAHACRLEHQHEIIYPATVNEAACAAKAAAAISDIWGDACLWTDGMPIMGAEDFSYYLEQKPGAYLLLGAGRDGQEVYPCHSSKFDYNDDLIPIVTALWSRLAGLEDSDHG